MLTTDQLAWFKQERGITKATLSAWHVDAREDGAIAFPYPQGAKLRHGIPDGKRRFLYEKRGQTVDLFCQLGEVVGSQRQVIVCEGETDTMRLWQEMNLRGIRDIGVAGLPGAMTWRDEMATHPLLANADKVWVILDNDDDYATRKTVDKAWRAIRTALGPKASRVTLPPGIKDMCEFFAHHSLEEMGELMRRQPEWNFPAIELRDLHLPRPTDWLIEPILARGTVGLLTGDAGAGKSWLSMDMALAVVTGRNWLGLCVHGTLGRVLIVDEENPEQLVLSRLGKLGLDDDLARHIRYVSQQGIDLAEDADRILDDALRFQPDLVIFDTWSSLVDVEDVSNRDVGRIFKQVLQPLARESGAAVLMLHHTVKPAAAAKNQGSASSRVRGGGAFKSHSDSAFEASGNIAEGGKLEHFKSRMSIPIRPLRVTLKPRPDDEKRMVVVSEPWRSQ